MADSVRTGETNQCVVFLPFLISERAISYWLLVDQNGFSFCAARKRPSLNLDAVAIAIEGQRRMIAAAE